MGSDGGGRGTPRSVGGQSGPPFYTPTPSASAPFTASAPLTASAPFSASAAAPFSGTSGACSTMNSGASGSTGARGESCWNWKRRSGFAGASYRNTRNASSRGCSEQPPSSKDVTLDELAEMGVRLPAGDPSQWRLDKETINKVLDLAMSKRPKPPAPGTPGFRQRVFYNSVGKIKAFR